MWQYAILGGYLVIQNKITVGNIQSVYTIQ